MAQYRYLTTDLVTNTVIGELPFAGVSWSVNLNSAGDFGGSLHVGDTRITNTLGTYSSSNSFTLDYVTAPARVGLYVERDGIIVWGGIIWSRVYDSGSQTLQINARSFESYFERRRIVSNMAGMLPGQGASVFAVGTKQFALIKSLVDVSNSVGLGVDISTAQINVTQGPAIGQVLAIYDYERRNLFDVIKEQSSQGVGTDGVTYGFDFGVNCTYDSSYTLKRYLNLYSPRRGTNDTTAGAFPMLEFPGSVIAYSWPEDGASVVTVLYGLGPGSADGQYISTQSAISLNSVFYPYLEDVSSYTNQPNPLVVDSLTKAEAGVRAQAIITPTLSWVIASDPVTGFQVGPSLSDFGIGDYFRLRINDPRFPNGNETGVSAISNSYFRLTKYTVKVGDSGDSETVSATFMTPTY